VSDEPVVRLNRTGVLAGIAVLLLVGGVSVNLVFCKRKEAGGAGELHRHSAGGTTVELVGVAFIPRLNGNGGSRTAPAGEAALRKAVGPCVPEPGGEREFAILVNGIRETDRTTPNVRSERQQRSGSEFEGVKPGERTKGISSPRRPPRRSRSGHRHRPAHGGRLGPVQTVDLKGRSKRPNRSRLNFAIACVLTPRERDGVRRKDEPVHLVLKGNSDGRCRARTGRHRRRRKAATLDPERRLDKEQEYIFRSPWRGSPVSNTSCVPTTRG